MGNSFQEKVSAWTDDELGDFETRRVTDEILSSEAARTRARHYHLIGAALRDEPAQALDQDFSQGVMSAIDALPEGERWDEHLSTSAASHQANATFHWRKLVAGGALAASVALISLLVLKNLSTHNGAEGIGSQPMATAPTVSQQPLATAPDAVIRVMPVSELARPVSTPVAGSPSAQPAQPTMQGSANARLLGSYMAIHAEQASHSTMLPRARMIGFDVPEATSP